MHTPSPDAEPGPHDSDRVVPPLPLPPEMEPLVPEPDSDEPHRHPGDTPGDAPAT